MRGVIGIVLLFGVFHVEAAVPHKGTVSSINVGTRFSSLLRQRGVIFYHDYQFDPIVAVFLFDDRVEYLGDSIGFRDFVYGDKIRLRSRLVSISDNPLFPVNKHVENAGVNRKDTLEWNNAIEIFLPGYNRDYRVELDLNHYKDIKEHRGNYLELQAKVKLTQFMVGGTVMEPNLVGSVGWGDAQNNQYYYGPNDDRSGLTNASGGVWVAFPSEADRYYPVIQLTHFSTLGDHGKGTYAQGRNNGYLLSFIATIGLLE